MGAVFALTMFSLVRIFIVLSFRRGGGGALAVTATTAETFKPVMVASSSSISSYLGSESLESVVGAVFAPTRFSLVRIFIVLSFRRGGGGALAVTATTAETFKPVMVASLSSIFYLV